MPALFPLFSLSPLIGCLAVDPTAENPLSFVVGANGGTLTTDSLKVEVPAGAVDSDITITAYPTTRLISGVNTSSQTWTFGPEGQEFNAEITVSFAVPDAPDTATVWWTKLGDVSTFTNQKTTFADGWASAAVAHFSEGAVGDDDQCNDEGDADTEDGSDDEGDADTGEESGDAGDDESEGGDCVDGVDATTGDDCDGGPSANGDDGDDGDEADGEHEEDGACEHEDHGDDADGNNESGNNDDGNDDGDSED